MKPPASRRAVFAAAAFAVLLLGACGDDDNTSSDATTTLPGSADTTSTTESPDSDDTGDTGDSIVDEVESTGEEAQAELEAALEDAGLTSLASAVGQVDLSSLLEGNEFTLFAPNDEAFLDLDRDALTDLLADPTRIADLLQNHIVVGEQLSADDLADAGEVTAESGLSLTVTGSGSDLAIADANVTTSETVGDGVFHVIDAVLTDGVLP